MAVDRSLRHEASAAPTLRALGVASGRPRAAWLGLASAGVLALGTLLPWAQIGVLSREDRVLGASTGDGRLALGAAALAAGLALLAIDARRSVWLYALVSIGIGAGVACLVNLADLRAVGAAVDGGGITRIDPGLGLWLSLAGAAALVISGLAAGVEAVLARRVVK